MIRLLNLARIQKCNVSDILGVNDTYVAFCVDEACSYIYNRLQKGDTVKAWEQEEKLEHTIEIRHVDSISDFYKQLGITD